MVNAVVQYRQALEKKLRCSKDIKDHLLEGFDKTLDTYLEEYSNPTREDLVAAFGPPEEMAEILMTEVTPQEQAQYRKFTLFKQILTIILVILLAISTVHLWFYKEVGLSSTDDVGVVDEFKYPSSNSDIGGDIP